MVYDRRMAKHIYLKPNERIELEQLIKSGTHSAQVMGRVRALLLLDRSQGTKRTMKAVSEATMLSRTTVHNVKKRYFADGVPGVLAEKPRPGRPAYKMTGDVEAQLIALACSDPPEGYDASQLYTDVSDDVATIIERELGGKFEGSGWRTFKWDE